MCAIVGALIWDASPQAVNGANKVLEHIFTKSFERGRDGRGYTVLEVPSGTGAVSEYGARYTERADSWPEFSFINPISPMAAASVIGNLRAEPTTEFVKDKLDMDQQPYQCGQWSIVHNGTIANDKELRTNRHHTPIDSAAIVELLDKYPTDSMCPSELAEYFAEQIGKLKGSYAILATHNGHPGLVLAACNYRPIWFAAATNGIFFASSRDYFPDFLVPQMLEPYSIWAFAPHVRSRLDKKERNGRYPRALVVCSGGMDSVVAARWAQAEGYAVTLVHFRYGSRAEGPEVDAIAKVAEHLGVGFWTPAMDIYQKEDSPLLQSDSVIAGGEAGAEFAHEWVPARNLVMLSIATAMAEAKGFDYIVLGNNLEEAGAYPDNEQEFIRRFNDMLPFAVGDGKSIEVLMPVGNLMKHEIVALGHQLDAPLHLTWSCYRAGELHCGTCGPCYMRRTAFEINNLPEVIQYAN